MRLLEACDFKWPYLLGPVEVFYGSKANQLTSKSDYKYMQRNRFYNNMINTLSNIKATWLEMCYSLEACVQVEIIHSVE